jgi:hypothetical protein
MQVRQVPFLHELGRRMPASRAASSKVLADGASNLHPPGSTVQAASGKLI